jgi:hypothetical protein
MAQNSVDPYEVNLSVILTNLRLKYPQYANLDNAKLTKSVLDKYPQYRNLLTPHGKMVADVVSGKHDPLGILDPQTSIKALREKYPDVKGWSDTDLIRLVNGKADNYPYLGERLTEDPTSPISSQHRPFTNREIADMPKFLKKTATISGMGLDEVINPEAVAEVRGGGTDIGIDRPEWFDRGVMSHELTHAYQNTRNADFQSAPDVRDVSKEYDYGGLPGLQKAIKDHKTIADFTVEQQADMVKHYYDAHRDMMNLASQGKIPASTAADFEEMKQAYAPFIRQMAGVPMEDEMNQPITAKTTPDAPSYTASGYITGDPNIMDFQLAVK